MNKKHRSIFWLLIIVLCTVTVNQKVVLADSIILDDTVDEKSNVSLEDADDFLEMHKEEFKKYSNEFEDDTEVKEINLWTYPYSDELVEKLEESYSNLPFVYLYYADYETMWGYIENEDRQGWICINNPNVPFFNRNHPDSIKDARGQRISEKQVLLLVVGLVAGLIIMTGVLIKIFWKKETK